MTYLYRSRFFPVRLKGFAVSMTICKDDLDILALKRNTVMESFAELTRPITAAATATPTATPVPTATAIPTPTPTLMEGDWTLGGKDRVRGIIKPLRHPAGKDSKC